MAAEILIPLTGRLDATSGPGVQELLLASLGTDTRLVTFDLQGITYVDPAGMEVLVNVFKQLRQQGGQVNLANPGPQVLELVEQARLDQVFMINWQSPADREQEEAAAERQPSLSTPMPTPASRYRPTAAAAPLGRSRNTLLYVGLVLSLALFAASQIYFHQHFTNDDLIPYLKGNAAMVRSVLKDYYRTAHRYPAGSEELVRLLQARQLNLHNVYTRDPLRVVAGRHGEPGDLLYAYTGNGFELRAISREGAPLRDKDGKEFVLTDRRSKA